MKKRNNFLEQIQKAQEASKSKPETEAPKPPGEITEAELDAEVERLEREVRRSKERIVEAAREELAASLEQSDTVAGDGESAA